MQLYNCTSDKAQIDNHKTTKRKYTLVDLKYRAISHSYLREALFGSAPAQKARVGEFYIAIPRSREFLSFLYMIHFVFASCCYENGRDTLLRLCMQCTNIYPYSYNKSTYGKKTR